MGMSQYLQGLIAGWLAGTDFPAPPAGIVMALSETAIGDDESGLTEITGTGYARKTVTFGAPGATASGVSVASDAPVVFGPAGADWNTAAHMGLYTNTGDLLFYAPLAVQRRAATGDTISFDTGQIQVLVGGVLSDALATYVLDWISGVDMPAAPTLMHLAVSTTAITRDGNGITEPLLGQNYLRQVITFDAAIPSPGVGTALTIGNAVIFGPASTSPWAQIVHGAFVDGSSGTLYAFGPLASPRTVQIGDSLPIPAGSASILIR